MAHMLAVINSTMPNLFSSCKNEKNIYRVVNPNPVHRHKHSKCRECSTVFVLCEMVHFSHMTNHTLMTRSSGALGYTNRSSNQTVQTAASQI